MGNAPAKDGRSKTSAQLAKSESSTSTTASVTDTSSSTDELTSVVDHVISGDDIPFDEIVLEERLGQHGWDADSFKGMYKGQEVVVLKFDIEELCSLTDFSVEDAQIVLSSLVPLSHANIVQFLGVCSTSPTSQAVVYEFSEHNLGKWLMKQHRDKQLQVLPFCEKLQICLDIARGVQTLHQAGISNIGLTAKGISLIQKDGRCTAKVNPIDAIFVQYEQLWSRSGLSPYLSPEIVNGGVVSEKSDTFSLGVIMWEILSARHSYEEQSENRGTVHLKVARDAAFRPSLTVLGQLDFIKQQFADLICDCWDHDPKQRPQLDELCVLLEDLVAQAKNPLYVTRYGAGTRQGRHRGVFHIDRNEIFGRDIELQLVKDTLSSSYNNRNASQHCRMMLVSGRSGIGKTVFVRKACQHITEHLSRDKFSFVSGQHEQLLHESKRQQSFSAIIQALSQLAHSKIVEPSERNPKLLKKWKSMITRAVGRNGQVLVDILPEIERIIGSQRPIPDLSPTDAKQRLFSTLLLFLDVVANAEHTLAIFIDNLQWADEGSLTMMEKMMSNPYVFFVGAYRDDEIQQNPPLCKALDVFRSVAKVQSIVLEPLHVKALNKICAKTLHCLSETQSMPLAQLICSVTSGNPMLFVSFFIMLEKEHLLRFDPSQSLWTWRMDEIKARTASLSTNLVDLMADKLRHLSRRSQQIVQLASFLGYSFEFNVLATVCEQMPLSDEVPVGCIRGERDLDELVTENILVIKQHASASKSNPRITCTFSHPRVLEAVCGIWDDRENERPRVDLHIGRLLKALFLDQVGAPPISSQGNEIFEVATRMNSGSHLMTTKKDLIDLIRINMQATLQAEKATAFSNALGFVRMSHELMFKRIQSNLGGVEDAVWQDQECYDLALSISVAAQRLEYVVGSFESGDEHFKTIQKYANRDREGLIARTKACISRCSYFESNYRFAESFRTELDFLSTSSNQQIRQIIIDMKNATLSTVETMFANIKQRLESSNYSQLSRLHVENTPFTSGPPEIEVLSKLSSASSFVATIPQYLFINFSLFDNYVLLADPDSTIPATLFDKAGLFMFGVETFFQDLQCIKRVAQEVLRHPHLEHNPTSLTITHLASYPLLSPMSRYPMFALKTLIPRLLAHGDLPLVMHMFSSLINGLNYSGKSIPEMFKIVKKAIGVVDSFHVQIPFATIQKQIFEGAVKSLMSAHPMIDPVTARIVSSMPPVGFPRVCFNMWLCIAHYMQTDFSAALSHLTKLLEALIPTLNPIEAEGIQLVLKALVKSRACDAKDVLQEMDDVIVGKLRLFAEEAHKDTFEPLYKLVSAERERLRGTSDNTVKEMYTAAIEQAHQSDMLLIETLAQQALLLFLEDRGMTDAAKSQVIILASVLRNFDATRRLDQLRADPRYRTVLVEVEERERKLLTGSFLAACAKGDLHLVKKKLRSNPQDVHQLVCCRDVDEQSPLHKAASSDSESAARVIKVLLDNGAQVKSFDRNQSTPLHFAASNGHARAISMMLSAIASSGGDGEVKSLVTSRDSLGYCPLHLAVRKATSDRDSVNPARILLLQGGNDPNIKHSNGDTALHIACELGAQRAVEFLLEQPTVKLNIKDRNGDTPLLRAARTHQIHIVKLLLQEIVKQQNGLAEHVDSRGYTLLHVAAAQDDIDLLRLARSVLVSEVRVIIHTDASSHNGEIVVPIWVKLLLIDTESGHHQTALHVALGSRSARFLGAIEEMLRETPSILGQHRSLLLLLSVQDSNGDTVVQSALAKHNTTLGQCLVSSFGCTNTMSIKNKHVGDREDSL